ncbi:MAG TPA: phosphatase PAP2 family protein [Microbacterium sp.]|nr:phosphatase PAP2 family protein [Microbacterium sp.]
MTADVGLLILAAATGLTLAVAWVRSPNERVVHISCVVGAAAVLAVSESTKALFQQERPCQQWVSESVCPPAGDWSFPSNHAALAFAALAVLVLVARTRWVTVGAAAVATAVGASRIVEQHHYLHDVVAGAILGLTVPIVCAMAAVRFRNHARWSRWTSRD